MVGLPALWVCGALVRTHGGTSRRTSLATGSWVDAAALLQLHAAREDCAVHTLTARWMWADASIIGHWWAEHDPLRWSQWATRRETITDLKGYLHSTDAARPVEVEVGTQERHYKINFANVRAAITELVSHTAPHGTPGLPAAGEPKPLSLRPRPRGATKFAQNASGYAFAFHPKVSQRFAHMAHATYCTDRMELHNWTCRSCKESGLKVARASVQPFYADRCALSGIVGKLEGPKPFTGMCVLALRGSESGNWWYDMDERQVKVPDTWACAGCYVHHGFLSYWLDLEASAVAALMANGCRGAGVIMTGHSLGGALATLGAWALTHTHNFTLAGVYTYESPRVGTVEFADAWDAHIAQKVPSFRVTNEGDPIPSLPCFWGAFTHVQTEVRFAEDGTFRVIPGREPPCDEFDALVDVMGSWGAHCSPKYCNMCGDDGCNPST